jgi:hypothetical protein
LSTPERPPVAQLVADYMATAAIFAGLVAIVYYPGRIGPGAIFIALVAAAMAGSESRLAPFAVAATTVSWLAGMIVAVLLEQPIF